MSVDFDTSLADSQATPVQPLSVQEFDFDAYQEYEQSLLPRCADFWQSDSGVAVYRRMRVAEVFSYGCRDMQKSLQWQLGGLKKSMAFKADIPNFLEPWYGIGTIASAYGARYQWPEGQAPAIHSLFNSVEEALEFEPLPVAGTAIGKRTLEMIEYFLQETKGRLPMSLTDTQSPLNSACHIVDINQFMMETVLAPDKVRVFVDRLADLLIDFTRVQKQMIGDNLVWPGHGFASARNFEGIGMSDDNSLMLSGQQYMELIAPAVEKFGQQFGGPVFHSCGNWADRVDFIKKIKGLRMVDGAFSPQTDPDPNPPEPFLSFANTGIVVNARIVGSVDTIVEKVKELWRPGMKLIVVTYCKTPEEQEMAYDKIHEICR